MSWDGSKVRRLANQVLGRYGSTCWLCGKPIDLAASRRSPLGLTVDHVIPRSKGGTDDITCDQRITDATRAGKPGPPVTSSRPGPGLALAPGLA